MHCRVPKLSLAALPQVMSRLARLMPRSLAPCALSVAFALGAGCTQKEQVPSGSVRLNAPLFVFEPRQVSELLISKHDPSTGDVWTARINVRAEVDRSRARVWEISSAPQGKALRDRLVDGAFVEHFLNTLTTFAAVAQAPAGPAETFGLKPPVFALSWTFDGRSFNVEIGIAPGKIPGRYALSRSQNTGTFIAQGAALHMLENLSSFEALRRRVLVTLESDDVDEIEVWDGKKLRLYAQRQGEGWVDRKKRRLVAPWSSDAVGALLDRLTHTRIKTFIDDREQAERIARLLDPATHPSLQRVILKDRRGNPFEIRTAADPAGVWASFSARPDGVFELHSPLLRPTQR